MIIKKLDIEKCIQRSLLQNSAGYVDSVLLFTEAHQIHLPIWSHDAL